MSRERGAGISVWCSQENKAREKTFGAAKSDKESELGWNTCDAKEKSHHPLFQLLFFFFAFTLTVFYKE